MCNVLHMFTQEMCVKSQHLEATIAELQQQLAKQHTKMIERHAQHTNIQDNNNTNTTTANAAPPLSLMEIPSSLPSPSSTGIESSTPAPRGTLQSQTSWARSAARPVPTAADNNNAHNTSQTPAPLTLESLDAGDDARLSANNTPPPSGALLFVSEVCGVCNVFRVCVW